MSVATATTYPTIYEADLPTVSYEDAPTPQIAHERLKQARQQGAIAMGAHGPEILSYELAHTALRDHRLCPPPGLGLEAQGITSGPLWDRVTASLLSVNGADHARLRRLVSKAFTPRAVARLDTTIVDIINQLIDPLMAVGRSEIVNDIGIDPHDYLICGCSALLQGLPPVLGVGRRVLQDVHLERGRARAEILKAWVNSTTMSTPWSPTAANRPPRTCSPICPRRGRRRPPGMAELRMLAVACSWQAPTPPATGGRCRRRPLRSPGQWQLLADHPDVAMKAVEELMRFYPWCSARCG